MKRDIVTIEYRSFAVPKSFDLNELRGFIPVSQKGETFVPEKTKITISLGENFQDNPQEVERITAEQAQDEARRNYGWYQAEATKTKKLEEELACLKQQLTQSKEESL